MIIEDPPATRGHEVAMALRGAYLAMHRLTDARLAERGVTADQFVVLACLGDSDALSQNDLVRRAFSDPSTLRAMLVRLEAKGLVARRRHPSDGRARSVRLTPRGRRLLASLWAESDAVRAQLVEALSSEEIETLLRGLATITETVRRIGVTESAPRDASPRAR